MRRVFVFVMLSMLLTVSLWSERTDNTSDYYQVLRDRALDNISSLPAERKELLSELLDDYPDVFMAFFLAFEEGSKLLLADTEDLKEHHIRVSNLWENKTTDYSLPFFLSYIAKITVTDERITPYHKLFAKYGLYEITGSDQESLVRELNLWCRRFMTFKPTSGRDMAPFDILERTNIGRCEEMQIFFISAARSLGIPARPASTPLWAHTDNNHAWVEVFVDNRWRYLGAVEPAYELDDAWFSSNVARAVMITTSAAFPDTSDIVLREDRYSSLINSTPNYDTDEIKSRKTRIITRNEAGEIIPEAEITLMVYNWGMLRPIYRTETNESGILDIVTGSGSFVISAALDSLVALYQIPFQTADYNADIVLRDKLSRSYETVLKYPEPQLPERVEREEWNRHRDNIGLEYNSIVSRYQDRPFPEEEADPLLLEIWVKCRNNKENFLDFYSRHKPLADGFLEITAVIDEKFLWQADQQQWQNLYDFFLEMEDTGYPDEINAVIISPTVLFEELPEYPLLPDLTAWRKGDIAERIERIAAHLHENYEVNDEGVVFSLLPYDQAVKLPVLTNYQYRMLACSVLRGNYIPAMYTRIPDVINIFFDDNWRYYDLKEQSFLQKDSESAEETLTEVIIKTVDENNYPFNIQENQISMTFRQQGLFFPAERQPQFDEEGILKVSIDESDYQIQIGYRVNNNETRFYLQSVESSSVHSSIRSGENELHPEESAYILTFHLDNYPRNWEDVTDEIIVLLDMLAGSGDMKPETRFLLLGDHDNEPVRRTADRFAGLEEEGVFLWIGTVPSPDAPEYYRVSERYQNWLSEHPRMKGRVLSLLYNRDEERWSFYDGLWDNLPE